MKIVIHKGSHQVGGSVTEISTDQARIIIDMGADLPSENDQTSNFELEGVTIGTRNCDAVLLTHYHGDHIGLFHKVMPEIPIYIGKTAKEILLKLLNRVNKKLIPKAIEIRTFVQLEKLIFKDITVTPLFIDHSAFDAYMFLIESNGIKILHTGDFRMHGIRGSKTLKIVKKYVGQVDYLICEGTMLSRINENVLTELELLLKAKEIMKNYKYVFVLCSSTNIDRIGAFYIANPYGRYFVCDTYQKEVLNAVREEHAFKSRFYNFKKVFSYGENLDEKLQSNGFCMLIRATPYFNKIIEKFNCKDSIIIYSMWKGYLQGENQMDQIKNFMDPYPFEYLHTSGHATKDAIKELCNTVAPKFGIIPMHSEKPDAFKDFCKDYNVLILQDGDQLFI